MRKCKYSIYIPVEYIQMEGGPRQQKEGTAQMSEEINGVFHEWGNSYEDGGEHGMGNYSVALVETEEGKIVEVLPCNITFLHTIQSQYVYDTVMLTGGRKVEVKDSGVEVWEEDKTKTNYTLEKKLKDWVSMDVKSLKNLAIIVLKDKALEFDAPNLTVIADNILEYVFYGAVDKRAYNPASIAIVEGLKPTDILKIKIFLEHNGYNADGMKSEINGFNISLKQ